MSELKELLEDLFYVRIGALAALSDSVTDKYDEYLERGKGAHKNGSEPNKELKHNPTVEENGGKDILKMLSEMSDEEKQKLKAALLAEE